MVFWNCFDVSLTRYSNSICERLWQTRYNKIKFANSAIAQYLTHSQYSYEFPSELYICDDLPTALNQFPRHIVHIVPIWQKHNSMG